MSHFLDRLTFFKQKVEHFLRRPRHRHQRRPPLGGRLSQALAARQDRALDARRRIARARARGKSTSRAGIVTWETQQTDYPRTRPDLPNHEPRGCARGASYSWYLYSGNRREIPAGALAAAEAVARGARDDGRRSRPGRRSSRIRTSAPATPPSAAMAVSCARPGTRSTEIIAAANAYTAKTYGPDRVFGFSPIPAMSMVSYAAGSRYLSLLGGVCMSFYDWYCDLPPASPQTWGEQTDVPEMRRLVQFRLPDPVGFQRAADPHARTRISTPRRAIAGAKSAVICPDYSEASKFADLWLHRRSRAPMRRWRWRWATSSCSEFHRRPAGPVFQRLCAPVHRHADAGAAGEAGRRLCARAASCAPPISTGISGETNNPEWKTVAYRRDQRRDRGPERLDRLPLGREGQVEPGGEGRRPVARSSCGCR